MSISKLLLLGVFIALKAVSSVLFLALSRDRMPHSKKTSSAPSKGQLISQELVLKSTSLARGRTESPEAFLGRVTHLHLQNKRITEISGLDLCTNLKVLYLYDNRITEIKHVENLKMLSYVYLQNNAISKLPELELTSLKKLFLDENEIEYVTGLESCSILEELFLARQRLPAFTSLEFDMASLMAVAGTLQVIDIAGNGVTSLMPLACLYSLRRIFAQDNNIGSLADIEAVIGLPRVEEACFLRNPCCTISRYRDFAIGASSDALRTLDEVAVLKHQQIGTKGLQEHRRKIGVAFPNPPTREQGEQQRDMAQDSLFGDNIDGESININDAHYSEADDVAFGAIPNGAVEEGKDRKA